MSAELRDANMQRDCIDARVAYSGNRLAPMPIEHDEAASVIVAGRLR